MIRNIRTPEGGFTILEVIIVMTITIALLGSALALFNQRIPRTQFETAVNELSVKITDAASQVATGYYPTSTQLDCTGSSISVGTNEQGTNENCIFVGQAIQLGEQITGGGGCPLNAVGANADQCGTVNFFTVFGKRINGGSIVTNLDDSSPKIDIDLAQQSYTTGFGMYISKVVSNGNSIGGLAYVQTFGAKVDNDGSPSGASQVEIVPLLGTNVGMTKTSFTGFINANTPSVGILSTPNPNSGVIVCLKSSQTDQYAIIVLGENGVTSDVSRQIFAGESEWKSARSNACS